VYGVRPFSYEIFAGEGVARQRFFVERPSGRWRR
jgi:hypothetical protein